MSKQEIRVIIGIFVVLLLSVGFGLYRFLFWPDGLRHPASVRRERFLKAGEQAQPLIDAIETFVEANGKPPATLNELVPRFIEKIPSTGLVDHTTFELVDVEDIQIRKLTPWELRIRCSHGLGNWDVFVYWPTRAYPKTMYGGSTEILGKWCYVWE